MLILLSNWDHFQYLEVCVHVLHHPQCLLLWVCIVCYLLQSIFVLMDILVVMYGNLPLSMYVLYTQMKSPHGYSWFDGLLRNPQSGVQTPQVLGYSGIRVALNPRSGVQTPTRWSNPPRSGVGVPHVQSGYTLAQISGSNGTKNHPTQVGTGHPELDNVANRLVTNSFHSPCQLSAEGGTWWQDSSNYGKGASLGRGASRHKNLQVARLMRAAVGGGRPCLRFHGS